MTVSSSVCRFSVWAKPIAYTVQRSAKAIDATSDTYYPTLWVLPRSAGIIQPRTPLRTEILNYSGRGNKHTIPWGSADFKSELHKNLKSQCFIHLFMFNAIFYNFFK
ncbi:hypothetical protein BV378_03770 [Nostoc sp. RF31YmG]|nr:hypothetical protein BV378_03770 [Nostoc sp. RF31YmG]